MAKSNNILFIFSVVILMFLFGLNESITIANRNSLPQATEDSKLHVRTIDDINEFIKLHPGVYVEQLSVHNIGGRIQYVLGARIAGDNLVAHGTKNQTWPQQQNVAITLTYPSSGLGKQITYVAIQVDQTSNFGQAYVLKGGLHQRSISIVVEAYTTFYLNYDAQFYGV